MPLAPIYFLLLYKNLIKKDAKTAVQYTNCRPAFFIFITLQKSYTKPLKQLLQVLKQLKSLNA